MRPSWGIGVWPLSDIDSKFRFQVQSQSNHRSGRGSYPPLLRLQFTHTGVKQRSGDKSLFPTCEFLIFGGLLHLGASQEWNRNGQTSDPNGVGGTLRCSAQTISRRAASIRDPESMLSSGSLRNRWRRAIFATRFTSSGATFDRRSNAARALAARAMVNSPR